MEYQNIQSPNELYDYMKNNIKYGFISKVTGKSYSRKELNNDELYESTLKKEYFIQSARELLNSKYGLCYDQVELEREWFNNNGYITKTYYSNYHNHAFLIYKKSDREKYYLFERTIKEINGIYEADSLEKILLIYKKLQLKLNDKIKIEDIKLYEYDNSYIGMGFLEFLDKVKK